MMQDARSVVTRVEFRLDVTRADAERIPLGFVVESVWPDKRWMGMIYRPQLTTNELKRINFDTWPELKNPEELLGRLFDTAWSADRLSAGSQLAEKLGFFSALHAVVVDATSDFADSLLDPSDAETAKALTARLHRYDGELKPACSATILSLSVFRKPAKVRIFNAPFHGEALAYG